MRLSSGKQNTIYTFKRGIEIHGSDINYLDNEEVFFIYRNPFYSYSEPYSPTSTIMYSKQTKVSIPVVKGSETKFIEETKSEDRRAETIGEISRGVMSLAIAAGFVGGYAATGIATQTFVMGDLMSTIVRKLNIRQTENWKRLAKLMRKVQVPRWRPLEATSLIRDEGVDKADEYLETAYVEKTDKNYIGKIGEDVEEDITVSTSRLLSATQGPEQIKIWEN